MGALTPELRARTPAHIVAFLDQNYSPALAKALQKGTGSAFPIISFKGKTWSIRAGGRVEQLLDANNDPVPSLQVVILGGNERYSKALYAGAFVEGEDATPICSSVNGVVPDPGVPEKQSATCASCPNNVWGSLITPQGTKGRKCPDHRRVAVILVNDLVADESKRMYGPMLLRVPPASLTPLAEFAEKVDRQGLMPTLLATKLGFNPQLAYPQLAFSPVTFLSPEQIEVVQNLVTSDLVEEILGSAGAEEAETIAAAQAKGPATAANPPAQQGVQQAQPAQQAGQQAQPTAAASKPAGRRVVQPAAGTAAAAAAQVVHAAQQAQGTTNKPNGAPTPAAPVQDELQNLFEQNTAAAEAEAKTADASGGALENLFGQLDILAT